MASMTMKTGSELRFEEGSWQEAAHDTYIGLLVGLGHVYKIFVKMPYEAVFSSQQYATLKDSDTDNALKNGGELKVVGVGFGRTGTYSLKLALEELGMPTLHTQHLYEPENEEIFKMWTDEIFTPSLQAGHASLGRPNLELIARHGYQATMDFPTALYYEQILEQYPNCKFILTKRQNSQVWYRSWETMTTSISTPANLGGIFLTGIQRYSIYLRWLFAMVNQDDKYITSTIPLTYQDPAKAIERYEEHNRKVKELIPPKQLLEYSVKQGWEPLCEFLEIQNCPTTPFPKTNSARSVQVQSVSSTLVPLIIILFVLGSTFSKLFEKLTGRTVLSWVSLQTTVLPVFLRKTLLGGEHYQTAYLKKHDDDPSMVLVSSAGSTASTSSSLSSCDTI